MPATTAEHAMIGSSRVNAVNTHTTLTKRILIGDPMATENPTTDTPFVCNKCGIPGRERRRGRLYCIDCKRDADREYYKKHKADLAEYQRRYYVVNSDRVKKVVAARRSTLDKDKVREYHSEYRAANRERLLELNRKYCEINAVKQRERASEWVKQNPERAALQRKRYREEHPDIFRTSNRNRRTRKRQGKFTAADISRIFASQCGFCAEPSCRADLNVVTYHIDHVVPLCLDGTNWPDNLQLLCPRCNLRKGRKHPVDWARENGRLF